MFLRRDQRKRWSISFQLSGYFAENGLRRNSTNKQAILFSVLALRGWFSIWWHTTFGVPIVVADKFQLASASTKGRRCVTMRAVWGKNP